MAMLEVICLDAEDARRAEAGGADRIELLGSLEDGGMSPAVDVAREVTAATTLPVRVMLRLRPGFGTDGGEFVRLRGLAQAYLDAGAEGIVMGFLNGHSEVDTEVMIELLRETEWPWTMHRAIDQAFDSGQAWRTVTHMPRLESVLTAGSARGVEHGLDTLLDRARTHPEQAKLIMAGGGLTAEHLPWLMRVGIRRFHIGRPARGGTWDGPVDPELVGSWRRLIDDLARRHPLPRK
ncbi:copper homeostasis protein CutC [Parenemella sanctibonifatiensis]|uniref:Copper homeostasis protein cutC homolog n=1 Tax=Parenemella sanctibonifatiensis TaxID=2016505 RepID=A0A255EMN6_9ACTN|nr:copper homeostasis protein CutC [Parenemella sanctibonifatiensis]OYN92470.1 copper homeostasis protein CutC [Parenemella sanctibonifatiensis]